MLKIAFIGAGQMARHHLRVCQRNGQRGVVVGVHDAMADRSEEFAAAAGTRAYPSVEALLEEARPDVVHVCTPPASHFDGARAALEGGAHVYVEKPFARTLREARDLIALAEARRLIVCAGHQLLRDPAFEVLLGRTPQLGAIVDVESHFAFKPASASASRGGDSLLARDLIDILPHPLYALVAVMERCGGGDEPISLAWLDAGATHVHAALRSGQLIGRLSVSVVARPVASWLTVSGVRGSLTCDFMRSVLVGAANAGAEPLEKIVNPLIEGGQVIIGSVRSLAQRVCGGGIL